MRWPLSMTNTKTSSFLKKVQTEFARYSSEIVRSLTCWDQNLMERSWPLDMGIRMLVCSLLRESFHVRDLPNLALPSATSQLQLKKSITSSEQCIANSSVSFILSILILEALSLLLSYLKTYFKLMSLRFATTWTNLGSIHFSRPSPGSSILLLGTLRSQRSFFSGTGWLVLDQ